MNKGADWTVELNALATLEKAGDWPALLSSSQSLWERARGAGEPAVAIQAALTGARHRANGGELESAAVWLQEVAEYAEQQGLFGEQVDAWVMLAGVHASRGAVRNASGALAKVMDLLGAADLERPQRQRAFNGLSVAYYQLGLNRPAARLLRESLELSPPGAGDLQGLMQQLNLAMLYIALHDESVYLPAEAAEDWLGQAQQQLDAAEGLLDGGPQWLVLFAATLRAGAQRRRGQAAEAVAALRLALATWPSSGPRTLHLFVRQELAIALGEHGATRAEARVLADELLALLRAEPAAATSMFQLENIALLADLAGRPEESFVALRRSLALARHGAAELLGAWPGGLNRLLDAQTQHLVNAELRSRNAALAQSVEVMSHAASFDDLTGTLNRRGMQAAFNRLRGDRALALILVDVDHFKSINDRFSHLVGDAVLRRLGALMQEAVRGPDAVARYGGEEFVLLLADSNPASALGVAERLRQRVRMEDWASLSQGLAVTVSLGVAEAAAHESFEEVLARVDRLMYTAKQKGRDRVEAHPQPGAAPKND